jgi:hypothetical protein
VPSCSGSAPSVSKGGTVRARDPQTKATNTGSGYARAPQVTTPRNTHARGPTLQAAQSQRASTADPTTLGSCHVHVLAVKHCLQTRPQEHQHALFCNSVYEKHCCMVAPVAVEAITTSESSELVEHMPMPRVTVRHSQPICKQLCTDWLSAAFAVTV